ncbi:MAG TPA: polysaccharide deacetylase family protein [Clostridia bacterium]|nr:polysaccharide deacetylase family protein [Clostridia bacterium]
MKVLILNKKSILKGILILCLAVAVLIAGISFVPRVVATMTGNRELPIYKVDRQEKIASLSFDAAWGNEDTNQLIKILNQYHVKATFFVVGQWVDKYPESVKALSDAGNEVMNHSNTHPHMTKLSRDDMLKEINACDEKISKITGKKPILFRAPYGDYSNALIETLTQSKHYCIQWDVDSLDWKEIPAAKIQQRVLSKVKNGSIILFHNAAKYTPEALPGILKSLQDQGYKLVPVSQLIYQGSYTIDHAGTQHTSEAAQSSQGASS